MNAVESVAGETQHITKGRLAHEVAKKIRDFHRVCVYYYVAAMLDIHMRL